MPGRKKINVHKLFEATSKVGKMERVKCLFCQMKISKSGSRMKKHIGLCNICPESVKEKYLANKESQSNIEKSDTDRQDKSLRCTTPFKTQTYTSPRSSTPKNKGWPSLLSDRSFLDKTSNKEQEQLDEDLSRALYATACPLGLLENYYWKKFFSRIRPSYKLPSRHQLSNSLLQLEYTRVSNNVKEAVFAADSLGFMCDGWSNVRNESIINFVVTLPSPVLWTSLPTGSEIKSAQYMCEEMTKVIEEVGALKVLAVVTDNAANMKAAWVLLREKFPHIFCYGCMAHGLNLLFSDYKSIPTLCNLMSDVVFLIKHIKNSHKTTAIFIETQNQLKQPGISMQSLKLPVQTRWGSTVKCLKSLQVNKHVLKRMAISEEANSILSAQNTKHILSDVFWDKIDGFLKLLSPISEAITYIESDKPLISDVVEIFHKLESSLNENLSQSPLSNQEELLVRGKFESRKQFCIKNIHYAANILNPIYKGKKLTDEQQVDGCEIIYDIATSMRDLDEDQVMGQLADYRSEEKIFGKPFVLNAINKSSAVAWWKGLIGQKDLSKLAVRLLNLPATSAPCERSFSSYSNVHSKKRNRLTNTRAAKLVYIFHNLKLEEKSYDSKKEDTHSTPSTSFAREPSGPTEEIILSDTDIESDIDSDDDFQGFDDDNTTSSNNETEED